MPKVTTTPTEEALATAVKALEINLSHLLVEFDKANARAEVEWARKEDGLDNEYLHWDEVRHDLNRKCMAMLRAKEQVATA